jgi:hypothetical protein
LCVGKNQNNQSPYKIIKTYFQNFLGRLNNYFFLAALLIIL